MATRPESRGKCSLCGTGISKRQALHHLSKCAYGAGMKGIDVVQLRVDVPGTPYWLDLDIKANTKLRDLDDFLRGIWLECCGHLSSFEVGRTRYVVAMSDGFGLNFLGMEEDERSMDAHVSAALPPDGSTFSYEYDYGSTTQLRLKVVAHHRGTRGRETVRLLARNDDPIWTCSECEAAATALCAYCFCERDAFLCDAHADEHDCGDEGMLPVVNSPRMGVCAYTG